MIVHNGFKLVCVVIKKFFKKTFNVYYLQRNKALFSSFCDLQRATSHKVPKLLNPLNFHFHSHFHFFNILKTFMP